MDVNRLKQLAWLKAHATLEACDKDTCLLWPFKSIASGYGRLSVGKGKLRGANTVACELAHGPAPEGKTDAAHGCGNSLCVNPHHLRWATRKENMADVHQHGGWRRKLTPAAVATIRANPEGSSAAALAAQFSVTEGTIHHIRRGHTWRAA